MTALHDNNNIKTKVGKELQFRFLRGNLIEKRDYQLSIAEKCVNKNSLVVIPTGLGKTIIALFVAARTLEIFPQNSKIIIMAPTRPLINQHLEFFRKYLIIPEDKSIILTGRISPKDRPIKFAQNQVLFFTPQTLRNDIVKQKYDLGKVCLMIFDEAHHATGDYAYVYLAEEYMNQNLEGNILALTASPGASDEMIEQLCETLHVPIENIHVRTRQDNDVKHYIKPVDIKKVGVALTELMTKLLVVIREIMEERVSFLDKLGLLGNKERTSNASLNILDKVYRKKIVELRADLISRSQQSEGKKVIYKALSAVAQLLILYHMESLVEQQGLDVLFMYLEKLLNDARKKSSSKARKIIATDSRILNCHHILELTTKKDSSQLNHPKMLVLQKILIEQFKSNSNSRVLIFVKLRDSVKSVTNKLKTYPHIRPKRFVGQAAKGKEKGLTQKDQINILEQFKKGKYNVLVSTNVGEEGLDIAECDLVIFYDVVASEIRLIQRKGRTARQRAGKVIILYTKDTKDEIYLHIALSKLRKMYGNLKSKERKTKYPANEFKLIDHNKIQNARPLYIKEESGYMQKNEIDFSDNYLSQNASKNLEDTYILNTKEKTDSQSKTPNPSIEKKNKKSLKVGEHQSQLTSFMEEVATQEALKELNVKDSISFNAQLPMKFGLRKELNTSKIPHAINNELLINQIMILDTILINVLTPQKLLFHEILLKNRELNQQYSLVIWTIDFINFEERISGEEKILKQKIQKFGQEHGIHLLVFDENEELLFMIKNLYYHNLK